MTYYVYKNRGREYSADWTLAGTFENYGDAKTAAINLCPKDAEIEHEPGYGMDAAFFGSVTTDRWSAMIDVRPLAMSGHG